MMETTIFPRQLYLSQTEVLKRYRINAKAYQNLLEERNIPTIRKNVNLGEFECVTLYVLKSDIEQLNLKPR